MPKKIPSKRSEQTNISLPQLSKKLRNIIIYVLLFISLLLPLFYIYYAYSVNKFLSFPLDDPWIHLQFARNLAEYGSFSYFKDEVVTSGSTSPLYTFLLAAGFLITKNEMLLSYALGILFFSLGLFYFIRLSSSIFTKEFILCLFSASIFVFDRWINFISVTGMETTMHIFLLIACYYFYLQRNYTLFAITLGLTIWSRPDAVAFIGAVIIDYLVISYFTGKSLARDNTLPKPFSSGQLIKIALITGAIISGYFIMNFLISGTILPNTYGAKTAYYTPELRSRTEFLKFEVWDYFTDSSYVLLFIPFVIAIVKIITDSAKKSYNPLLIAALFIFLLIFIYWYKLPYAHRFGRYLMPVIPFYILLAVYGTVEFFRWLHSYLKDRRLVNFLISAFLFTMLIYSAYAYYENRILYQEQTRHIYIRQVKTANWIRDNTDRNSIVATHDVGAIAYYSGRKIIDIVGLINPEFIPKLHDRNFNKIIEEELNKRGVTHLAFLREWFQVVNQPRLFSSGDMNFEIMEVYRYIPGKTHILSQEANNGIMYAGRLLNQKLYGQAISVLKQVASIDPQSSFTFYMLAYAYSQTGDNESAVKYLNQALQIYPDYKEAVIALSNIYRFSNKISEARQLLDNYMKNNPSDQEIEKIYKSLGDSTQVP